MLERLPFNITRCSRSHNSISDVLAGLCVTTTGNAILPKTVGANAPTELIWLNLPAVLVQWPFSPSSKCQTNRLKLAGLKSKQFLSDLPAGLINIWNSASDKSAGNKRSISVNAYYAYIDVKRLSHIASNAIGVLSSSVAWWAFHFHFRTYIPQFMMPYFVVHL